MSARQGVAIGREHGLGHRIGAEGGAYARLQPVRRGMGGRRIADRILDRPGEGLRIAGGDQSRGVGTEDLSNPAHAGGNQRYCPRQLLPAQYTAAIRRGKERSECGPTQRLRAPALRPRSRYCARAQGGCQRLEPAAVRAIPDDGCSQLLSLP